MFLIKAKITSVLNEVCVSFPGCYLFVLAQDQISEIPL